MCIQNSIIKSEELKDGNINGLIEENKKHLSDSNITACQNLGYLYRELGKPGQSLKYLDAAGEKICSPDDIYLSNKILNEKELTLKRTKLTSKPRGLYITLTNKCNINCIMCRFNRDPWEFPESRIDEILEMYPYLNRIHWQGGEVFMLDYFDKLFEKASQYPQIEQSIITNGLLINDRWAKKFSKSKVCLCYSIDGITGTTYEKIRKGAKFKDLLKSLNLINRYRDKGRRGSPDLFMNFLVMKSNHKELPRAVEFASRHGFGGLHISPVDIITGPENIFYNRDSRPLQYIKDIMPEIKKQAEEYGINLQNCLPEDCSIQHEQHECKTEETRSPACYWPWQYLFIMLKGKVSFHCNCPHVLGNIESSSLKALWNSKKAVEFRESLVRSTPSYLCKKGCRENRLSKTDSRMF